MMSSSDPAEDLPAVDARIVAPESGYEILDGKVVEVPPADEPHGTRQSKVAALLEASVADAYHVAVEMLTRTSKTNDFAPDASVFPRARDPKTGGRRLEELAFEILSTQSLSDAGAKAAKLSRRGIRRVFAIDIPHERVFEWVARATTWRVLPDAGAIEDRCLAAPLPVEALVKASRADDGMARALLAKHNPVLTRALDDARDEGLLEGARRALLAVVRERGLSLTPVQRRRVNACTDLDLLETWIARATAAEHADRVFDAT